MGNCGSELNSNSADPLNSGPAMWSQSQVELTWGTWSSSLRPYLKIKPIPVLLQQAFDKGKLSKGLLKEVLGPDKRYDGHGIESPKHAPKNSINQSNQHP